MPKLPELARMKADGDTVAEPYHHGNLRAALIACGKKRLETEGVDTLSLRRIAADAGVSQAAPTHHFGNKEGLLAAIAADGFRDLMSMRLSRLRPAMTAEQKLRLMLETYVEFAHAHPSLFQAMFAPHIKHRQAHAELDSAASESYLFVLRIMQEFIDEKTASGLPLAIHADDATRFAWCSIHGLATAILEMRFNPHGAKRFSRAQLTARTIDLVLAGIQAERTPAAGCKNV